MECKELEDCFKEIEEYCNKPANGLSLLVHTENEKDLQRIISRMKADRNKSCVYLSEACENQLFPQEDKVKKWIHPDTCTVLIGLSSYGMLMGRTKLQELLKSWMEYSPCEHLILLLCHVKEDLLRCMGEDPRLPRRVIFLQGESSPLPRIRLFPTSYEVHGEGMIDTMQALLHKLETYDSSQSVAEYKVRTRVPKEQLADSLFSISAFSGFYQEFTQTHPQVASMLQESWGSEAEWKRFASDWEVNPTLDGLAKQYLGMEGAYSQAFSTIWNEMDEYKKWFLWLLFKVKGVLGNPYLAFAVSHSQSWKDLWEHIYLDITQVEASDPRFHGFFTDRKKLLKDQAKNASYCQRYQTALEQKGRDGLYYLSDSNVWEQLQLFFCLSNYSYEKKDIQWVLDQNFQELAAYMKPFSFNVYQLNGDDTQEELCKLLGKYFTWYKWQKLENHVDPDFEAWVEELATRRVYNQLPERSLLMKQVDRNKATVFFVDALGVEYVSYIQEKCKQYGMLCQFRICHGQLPSITSENKEFVSSDVVSIKELDELKHHSPEYNYEKQRLPIHLMAELQAIDKVLDTIKTKLLTKEIQRAVVVSDHGATRLAVISEEEKGADFIVGENKGQHGGRCCMASEDPQVPYVVYENGYAVLANYSRFKGSRKADVEVHGGATLEEVLVPLLYISLKPEDMKVEFIYDTVLYKKNVPIELLLKTNFDIEKPILKIKGKDYEGKLDPQKKRVLFVLDDIKRKGNYTADVYDGGKLLREQLAFHVKTALVKEKDVFDF